LGNRYDGKTCVKDCPRKCYAKLAKLGELFKLMEEAWFDGEVSI